MSPSVLTRLATPVRTGAAAVSIALLTAACTESAPPPPPPPEVSVVTVESQPISDVIEVPGRLQAVRTADVRARVDGILERRLYVEGTDVRANQPLFAIDPRPLRAQLSAAEANLARAEANAANARQDVRRYDGLVGKQAISQQEYDAAVARLRTAEADVAAARAQVEAARLNLSYATVTAPIAGRASRAAVTEGALVSGAQGTLLTRIEQLDPIFVNFSQSSAELMKIREALAKGGTGASVTVRLVLEDGTAYDKVGKLDFLDLAIDEATGTAALRAEIPNPDRILLPGQFVRVRVELGAPMQGLLVPQRAVSVTAQGSQVMVLAADGTVEARPVTLGAIRGNAWEVRDGLQPGERVITDGLQKVRPGQPVRVASESAPSDSTLSATASTRDGSERGAL